MLGLRGDALGAAFVRMDQIVATANAKPVEAVARPIHFADDRVGFPGQVDDADLGFAGPERSIAARLVTDIKPGVVGIQVGRVGNLWPEQRSL
ncbi:MAG: hypothetical protein NVS3B27_05510 [Novosphingobium sp.]